jgi:Domain of unknown function (DUF4400)
MIEVNNPLAKHGVFWMFVMPTLALLALPALLSPASFVVSAQEITFFEHTLARNVPGITAAADRWFETLFIQTHIAPAVRDFFNSGQVGSNDLLRRSGSLSRSYNDALWLMVYRGLWRLAGLWPVVIAIALSLGLPCLIDGLMVRARKSYNFEFHNPVFFWSASHSLVLILGLGVFLPFLPIALTPAFLAGFTVLLCLGLWVTASNFQTGN